MNTRPNTLYNFIHGKATTLIDSSHFPQDKLWHKNSYRVLKNTEITFTLWQMRCVQRKQARKQYLYTLNRISDKEIEEWKEESCFADSTGAKLM